MSKPEERDNLLSSRARIKARLRSIHHAKLVCFKFLLSSVGQSDKASSKDKRGWPVVKTHSRASEVNALEMPKSSPKAESKNAIAVKTFMLDIRSEGCRRVACAISCPKTAARPFASRVMGSIPVKTMIVPT
jgi:hypothetical protein